MIPTFSQGIAPSQGAYEKPRTRGPTAYRSEFKNNFFA